MPRLCPLGKALPLGPARNRGGAGRLCLKGLGARGRRPQGPRAPPGSPGNTGAGIPEGPGGRTASGDQGVRGLAPPRAEPRGPDREGLPGCPAPPRPAPPSRASWRLRVRRLFVLRRWGPGRPRHPTPGSRERPRETPRPRRAPEPASPTQQRPLQALFPESDSAPGGRRSTLACAPRGASPSPLPGHGPGGLDASKVAAAGSKPGGRMDGAGGPGEYGAGRAACPSRSAGPVAQALPVPDGGLVASPRASWPQEL